MTMKWPTSDSREKKVISQADQIDQILKDVRITSLTFKNDLATRPTTVTENVGIFQYFILQLEALTVLTADRDVLNVHSRNIGIGQTFDDSNVDVVNDRFLIDDPQYRLADRVRVIASGVSDLPAPFLEGTNYFVTAVQVDGFQLAASDADALTGTFIPIDDAGTGQFRIEARLNNAGAVVQSAMQTVIDTIDAGVPKDANQYVLAYQLDPTGATGINGVVDRTINPSQTGPLQDDLQAVVDAIEAPA